MDEKGEDKGIKEVSEKNHEYDKKADEQEEEEYEKENYDFEDEHCKEDEEEKWTLSRRVVWKGN